MTRRSFFSIGGAAIAGSALKVPMGGDITGSRTRQGNDDKIKKYVTLGRTGFQVSDIAVGGVPLRDTAVVRHAYEKGINYFDLGESYGRGAAEEAVGEAMPYMERDKIFITTKIGVGDNDTVDAILDRFQRCKERLQTEYIDAFDMHGVNSIAALSNAAFHTATDRLKADGQIRFIGLSCHGPGRGGDSMEDVLLAAVEDGRFDLFLFTYNFLNSEVGDKVLAACKEKNIGTTAMKTKPGSLLPTPFDPDNPTEQQAQMIERAINRGRTRERAIQQIRQQIQRQEETYQNTRPFLEKYGITTQEELDLASIHWVVQSPDMHTTCVGSNSLDIIDKVVPLSGTTMTPVEMDVLREYGQVISSQYCRHGCSTCAESCPHDLPVSTIMRYAYYYECQGREKEAMVKYAGLDDGDASLCMACDASCRDACPYGIDVQANLLEAHSRLTL